MRLIDADALLENQPKGCYRTSDWINAAPTIDAIPVEWMEKQAEYARSKWDYDTCEGIRIVLKEWQKEQEAR